MGQWELTTIPVIALIFTPASKDRSPGAWEMIIVLIILLILFGANRLPDMVRGMGESIRNFKDWRLHEQRPQSGDHFPRWFPVVAVIAAAIILPVLSLDVFSDEQKLALAAVLLVWIGVGYWSFGRKRGDR